MSKEKLKNIVIEEGEMLNRFKSIKAKIERILYDNFSNIHYKQKYISIIKEDNYILFCIEDEGKALQVFNILMDKENKEFFGTITKTTVKLY